jgi:uncharacterized protein YciI
MTWFTVETRYIADRDRLQAVRPRHREYLQGLAAQGLVLAGGPYTDDKAGFAVYQVADEAELDRLLADDPYTTEGIAEARTIREWRITLGKWAQ